MKNPINIALASRLLNAKYNNVKKAVEQIESEISAPKYMVWGTGGREYVTRRNLENIKRRLT